MVEIRSFARCELGRVNAVTISAERLRVTVLDYGATVQSVLVPDRAGVWRDVCLGYDTLEEYRKNPGYLGAAIGRNCNRIGGAAVELGGVPCALTANEGRNQLHGGLSGFDRRLWDVRAEGERAVFRTVLRDGEDGFPGNLRVQLAYYIENGCELHLEYTAVSDRDTVANFTNHSYWILNGAGSGSALGQLLRLNADRYTPADAENIPTGELRSTAGTCYDFRTEKPLGRDIGDPALAAVRGYDHNYCLNGTGLREAVRARSEQSGITLTVFTTQPGLQLYTANFLGPVAGKGGAVYGPHDAFCLETQFYPDAVHHENFPSPVLKAGDTARQTTICRFTAIKEE